MKLEIISKYPDKGVRPTPLLFVHGALHGAWCWDVHFLDYFAEHGYPSHALNLRGHGNSEGREKLRWTRIADFVDDIAQVADELPSLPVLIGHSMGGFTIQKYLEDHIAAGAVLLSSPAPSGMLPTALKTARLHPAVFAKVSLTFSLLPTISSPALARQEFFSDDVPDEELVGYWRQMQDDSYMAYLDMVVLDLPNPQKVTTPVLVLGAERDAMLSRQAIEATATAYHTEAQFIPGVAHNSMLELRWRAAADRILAWLDELDSSSVTPRLREVAGGLKT